MEKNALLSVAFLGESVELEIILGSGSDTKPRLPSPLFFAGRCGRPSAFFRLGKESDSRKQVIVGGYGPDSDLPPFYLLS